MPNIMLGAGDVAMSKRGLDISLMHDTFVCIFSKACIEEKIKTIKGRASDLKRKGA